MRIKHKLMITLLSLMELRENDRLIMNRMRKSVPLTVLSNLMVDIYILFKDIFNCHYNSICFNQASKTVDISDQDS